MRDTSCTELLVDLAFSVCSVVVFDVVLEVFCDNVALKFGGILINAQTNESYFVLPGFFAFGEHINVMFHGSLARRAPGGPKIEKNNFTCVVLEGNIIVGVHFTIFKLERGNVCDGTDLVSDAVLASNFNRDFCIGFRADCLNFLLDLVALLLFGESNIAFDSSSSLLL